jgi:hypothetical protein
MDIDSISIALKDKQANINLLLSIIKFAKK